MTYFFSLAASAEFDLFFFARVMMLVHISFFFFLSLSEKDVATGALVDVGGGQRVGRGRGDGRGEAAQGRVAGRGHGE